MKREKINNNRKKKLIFVFGLILILLIALFVVFLIFKEKILFSPAMPGFPSEEVAKKIIAERTTLKNEVLTCQKEYKTTAHTSLCSSRKCSLTSKYIGCSSYTSGTWIRKIRYYQEICRTIYTKSCSVNSKCPAGEKEISRVKC